MVHRMVRLQCDQIICARICNHEKTFRDRGSENVYGHWVKDHYKKLGFKKISEATETEIWELNVENYNFQKVPMRLKYNNQ